MLYVPYIYFDVRRRGKDPIVHVMTQTSTTRLSRQFTITLMFINPLPQRNEQVIYSTSMAVLLSMLKYYMKMKNKKQLAYIF